MTKLIIGKSPVSTNTDGLISLTDLWKAAGGAMRNRPKAWLDTQGTADFISAVAGGQNPVLYLKIKHGVGTYAHWQIALAYAKYLSPELHMQVNEVFMRYKAGDPKLAEEVIDKRFYRLVEVISI